MAVTEWPKVVGEFETIRRVLEGFSIARIGDGEFKLAFRKSYRREEANPTLARELRDILTNPRPQCLPAIPTMDPKGAKYESWARHEQRFKRLLSADVQYYSSFISRPDSAQWIMVREYAELFQKVWAGKWVAMVCEPDNSMLGVVHKTAKTVTYIQCPSNGAYALIDNFERLILRSRAEVAILSVGPTATCLANRLSNRIPTIDAGSCGGFLRKLLDLPKAA